MIREAIARLVAGESLSSEEAAACMDEIMGGEATPAQFGAFVTALRLKGETVDEIVGLAETMRRHALRLEVEGPVLDTCGTGGDGAGSFNVSTAAAFVAAGAGVRVAKHGNRAMSSASGSADVLEALGVRVDLPPDAVRRCLEEVGIAFLFAQVFHPAMKFAAGPRREIGIRTVFNILGPLTNPAGARHQVLGVAEEDLAQTMAQALERLGVAHALVVHGLDGLDELSISGPSIVADVHAGGSPLVSVLDPADYGFAWTDRSAIRGGSPADNATRMRAVLAGERGPYRDVTLLNAAAALVAADAVPHLRAGIERAAEAIDSGAAAAKLDALVWLSQRLA